MNPFGDPLYEGTEKMSDYNEEYFIDFQTVPQRGEFCETELATKNIRLFVCLNTKDKRFLITEDTCCFNY